MIGAKIIFVFLLHLYCSQINAARILAVFPMPSLSHQVVFRPITEELARRGHQVTVITPYPAYPQGQAPPNLTEINVYDKSYYIENEIRHKQRGYTADMLSILKYALDKQYPFIERQLQTLEVQTLLTKPNDYFDLLLLEACCFQIASGLGYKFDAPIIQISSFGTIPAHYNIFGAPMNPLLYATPNRQRIYNLSRWEKISEFFKYVAFEYYLLAYFKDDNLKTMRKIFGNVQKDIHKRIKLLFLNEHRIWVDNRPISSNIQYIGGIHQPPEKELPKELKSYLDASKNGVIYLSFGSNIFTSALPTEKIEIMNKVFSNLDYDVLVKWNEDEMPGQPPNVRTQKWFPQSDLLKHPKIKLFITQAGLQSTEEAINAAVPLLGIPIFGDQWYNAEKYVHHKVGMTVDLVALNELEFKNCIETVIKDNSYKKNMLRLRKLMSEHPVKPLDLAVWWTEHIIKHGGDHLVPPSANITWIEYYEVELMIISLSVVFAFIFLIVYVFKNLSKLIRILLVSHKNK